MKKIFFIVVLIMGIFFNINAQTVQDTIYYTDSVEFFVDNDTTFGGLTDIAAYCIGYYYIPYDPVFEFTIENLTDDMQVFIRINGVLSDCYDTVIHIDTNYRHPGVYNYDTTMVVESIIKNGYNEIPLSRFFELDSVDCIEMFIEWDGEYHEHIITLTDVTIIDNTPYVGIDNDYNRQIVLYPNPTTDFVYIYGYYKKIIVTNSIGQIVLEDDKNTGFVDISKLPKGTYFFLIDNIKPRKVVKL